MSYVVRLSSKDPGCFGLTFKNQLGEIKHTKITRPESGIGYAFGGKIFDGKTSLLDCIEYVCTAKKLGEGFSGPFKMIVEQTSEKSSIEDYEL